MLSSLGPKLATQDPRLPPVRHLVGANRAHLVWVLSRIEAPPLYHGWEGGVGVLVGGASRSKRLTRAVVVCARGSQRVSELAAEEDTHADRPRTMWNSVTRD